MSSNSSDLWTPPNTENIAVGVFYLILSSFFLIVYAPTITVLSKDEEMMNLPVFKLLMWDSVCDIIQVAGAGLAAGIYSLLNNVSNRPTNLVIGSIINICWLAGIFLDATVALNRFLALTSEYLTTKLFSNRRCYIWLGISFSYAIFFNTVYLVRGGGVIYGLDFYSWYYSDAPGMQVIVDQIL